MSRYLCRRLRPGAASAKRWLTGSAMARVPERRQGRTEAIRRSTHSFYVRDVRGSHAREMSHCCPRCHRSERVNFLAIAVLHRRKEPQCARSGGGSEKQPLPLARFYKCRSSCGSPERSSGKSPGRGEGNEENG